MTPLTHISTQAKDLSAGFRKIAEWTKDLAAVDLTNV